MVRLENVNCFIVINDEQLRDPLYADYVYNYISYIGKDEECILMDEELKTQITDIEVEHFMNNKENFRYNKNKKPKREACLQTGIKKLMQRAHVVMVVNDMQTYHEWMSLFPGLETKCDVMFVDDLTPAGYRKLTRSFLERTKIDEDMEEREKNNLVESMYQAKEIAKTKVLENFYIKADVRDYHYVEEEYCNGQGQETMYPNETKVHKSLLEDGNFTVYDPLLKQISYNLRADLNAMMRARYVMYLEVFRFLYDFLSLNLTIRKNYYETFFLKTHQFHAFFEEIQSKKKSLHDARASNIHVKRAMIQDEIDAINKAVTEKRETILHRKAEIDDLELQLKNQQGEVDQVLEDKNRALEAVLQDISQLDEREVAQIATT